MVDVINKMAHRLAEWLLQEARDSDIIVSSRARLARNLQNTPFVDRASEDQQKFILSTVLSAAKNTEPLHDAYFFDFASLDELDRRFLVERRLISADFAEGENTRGLLVTPDEKVSVMINEEDHLRIQVVGSGFCLESAWDVVHRMDQEIACSLEFAFSKRFGYLTACPTNVGTGVRFSVFVHLPVLTFEKEIENLFAEVIPAGVAVRGFYGEGSRVVGNFFQISNQYTLGWTEEGILDRITPLIERVIEKERRARERAMNDQRVSIEDKVFRAQGILAKAKILSFMELLDLLSAIRLGVDLAILPGMDTKVFNELMVLMQPAHIQKGEAQKLSDLERDVLRAKLVREKLHLS